RSAGGGTLPCSTPEQPTTIAKKSALRASARLAIDAPSTEGSAAMIAAGFPTVYLACNMPDPRAGLPGGSVVDATARYYATFGLVNLDTTDYVLMENAGTLRLSRD